MVFSSWFASRRSAVIRQLSSQSPQSRLARHRLHLEALEDRTVPTVTLGTALSVGHELGMSSALDIVTDATGSSYTTGYFSGTTDFDPAHSYTDDTDIITARGMGDAFIAKYAPDSSLIWVRRMGGDSTHSVLDDRGRNIAIDTSGNIYITGDFFGSADFGSTTLESAGGESDGFTVKLNSNGVIQWANRWGTTAVDYSHGVAVDASGNSYALGFRQTDNKLSIYKYSTTGSSVWTQSIVTRGRFGADLTVDASGNVFVCGDFQGIVDFDPSGKKLEVNSGPSSVFIGGAYCGFVLKLTTAGKLGWVSPFRTTTYSDYSTAGSIVLDGTGNIIVGGINSGSTDFNPGSGTTTLPASSRAYIAKLNSSGGLVWARGLVSANNIDVFGLAVDTTGSIYATGYFAGTVDFDPGAAVASKTTAGGDDVYVMKLNSSGNFNWAESFGSGGNDIGRGIAVDSSGTIHLAGSYQGIVDFDPDPTDTYFLNNLGTYNNMFLVRLKQS